ncbi:MAG: hypothetical protein Q9195_004975 [Heterodermia aff. obscurata]
MRTTLKFLKELPLYESVQPYKLHGFDGVEASAQTNCIYEDAHDILIEDLREKHVRLCINESGFEFITQPSRYNLKAEHFEVVGHGEAIIVPYVTETMDIVRRHMKAQKVIAIDWRIQPAEAENVHFSYTGGHDRLRMHLLGSELDDIQKKKNRAAIVNAWRPLDVVDNAPLVLSDRTTVRKSDLVEVDEVLPDKLNKTFYVYQNSAQRWYWLSSQSPSEMAIFITWTPETDSEYAGMYAD